MGCTAPSRCIPPWGALQNRKKGRQWVSMGREGVKGRESEQGKARRER
jgi:hypothetical protein